MRPRLKHIRHPIDSAKSLGQRLRQAALDRLVERLLGSIRRDERDRCWCGGALDDCRWQPQYGVCVECGCYVNRQPPRLSEFNKLYGLYWGLMARARGWPPMHKRAAMYEADGRLGHWLQLVAKHGPPTGTVVEVGCAPGILLHELQSRGYQCAGVEVNAKAARWIRKHMGVDVRDGLFPSPDLQLPKCDLFVGLDVLEHVPAPDAFLREAQQLLNPGGVAIIQAPIDRHRREPPFGNETHAALDGTEHLFVFVDEAMARLGAAAGLELVSLDEEPWAMRHEVCIYRKPARDA